MTITELMREKGLSYNEAKERLATGEQMAVRSTELLAVFGTHYPILADMKDDGWYLVAHPNGPAIANKHFDFLGSLAHPCGDIPEDVRNSAVWQLMKWAKRQPTWPTANAEIADKGSGKEATNET